MIMINEMMSYYDGWLSLLAVTFRYKMAEK